MFQPRALSYELNFGSFAAVILVLIEIILMVMNFSFCY